MDRVQNHEYPRVQSLVPQKTKRKERKKREGKRKEKEERGGKGGEGRTKERGTGKGRRKKYMQKGVAAAVIAVKGVEN